MAKEKVAKTREEINADRVNCVVCMLYPNEDENHKKFIKYVKAHDYQYRYAMIVHDKDVYQSDDDEVINGKVQVGTPKKPHVHFMLWQKERQTLSAIHKYFNGWVAHFERCNSIRGQLNYFIHDTPQSLHKYQYSPTDIEGSPKLLLEAFNKTEILYNLGKLAEMCKNAYKLTDIIAEITNVADKNEQEVLFETFKKWQHVIVAMSNQEINEAVRSKYRNESNIDKRNS